MAQTAAFLPPLLLLAALILGLGAGARKLSDGRVARGAMPVVGLATLIVLGQFATLAALPALPSALIAAGLAGAGLIAGGRELLGASRWALGAAAAVSGVYLGAVALGGQSTFGGYTQLADTAIHLLGGAYLPGAGPQGEGAAAGAWRAYYETGYPSGGAAVLGMVSALSATAPTHGLQPLLALAMATVAASAWALLGDVISRPSVRAVVASLTALPALTFGFVMQGSLKEVLAAAMVIGLAAALPAAPNRGERIGWRGAMPPAILVGALIACLGGAAVVYVAPFAGIALLAWARASGVQVAARAAALVVALAVVLSIPTLSTLGNYLEVSGTVLTAQAERGNLASDEMPKRELSGIWIGPDFRTAPRSPRLSDALGTVALLLAVAGYLATGWRWWRRPSGTTGALAGWLAGSVISTVLVVRVGSPWADWKAYAILSPTIVAAAGIGLVAVWARASRRARPVVVGVGALLAGGVVSSVALMAHAAPLAPTDRFGELARIDREFAGRGPMFTAEYEEFTRALLPRTQTAFAGDVFVGVPGTFQAPRSGDPDGLDPSALGRFRLMLLRTGPLTSRPPGDFVRRFRGRWYEVWERDPARAAPAQRLALGEPGGTGSAQPTCEQVRAFAAAATPGQQLRFTAGHRSVASSPAAAHRPAGWAVDAAGLLRPRGDGTVRLTLTVEPRALVDVWLEGRDARRLSVSAGGVQSKLQPPIYGPAGSATRLLTARADEAGRLDVTIRRAGSAPLPGRGDRYSEWATISASAHDQTATRRTNEIDPRDAAAVRRLCDQTLDWLELTAAP